MQAISYADNHKFLQNNCFTYIITFFSQMHLMSLIYRICEKVNVINVKIILQSFDDEYFSHHIAPGSLFDYE